MKSRNSVCGMIYARVVTSDSLVLSWRVGRTLLLVSAVLMVAATTKSPAAIAAAGETCPNAALRTGASAALPDCRAYELVSPAVKNGNNVQGLPGLLLASEDGERVTYYSGTATVIPSGGPAGTQDFPSFLASRDPVSESWDSQRLLPPQSSGRAAEFLGASANLRFAAVEAEQVGYESPGYGRGLYLINTATEETQSIVQPEENQLEVPFAFDGASEDGSRIFFETKAAIAPGATAYDDNLYVWERSTGKVTLAGLVPGEPSSLSCSGTVGPGSCVPAEGSFGGAYEWYEESNPYEGGALKGLAVGAVNAISPSGDQIYFTSANDGDLYLRNGIGGTNPATELVSGPAVGVTDPVQEPLAAFQEATPDGRYAFFLSNGELTSDSNTGGGMDRDLYRWDAATGEVLDLTPDAAGEGAEVQALVGAGEDGQAGYLVARAALPVSADGLGEPVAGDENLYRFSLDSTGINYEFIAGLEPSSSGSGFRQDKQNWSPRAYEGSAVVANNKLSRASRVDAGGNTIVFTSSESVTGYDNHGPLCNPTGSTADRPCNEVYLSRSGPTGVPASLVCVSCDPSGAQPVGSAALNDEVFNTNGTIFPGGSFEGPTGAPAVVLPLNLSSEGFKVFFQSANALVPTDTNGQSGCPAYESNYNQRFPCQDVYEWEAPGSGSCHAAEVNGGCVYLISTGTSELASYFAGASANGESAFIITTSKAAPIDQDGYADLYDARVNGGLPSQQLTAGGPCSGESCLEAPPTAPASATPGSSQGKSTGNVRQKHRVRHKHRRRRRSHKRHSGHRKKGHSHSKPKHNGKERPRLHRHVDASIGGVK